MMGRQLLFKTSIRISAFVLVVCGLIGLSWGILRQSPGYLTQASIQFPQANRVNPEEAGAYADLRYGGSFRAPESGATLRNFEVRRFPAPPVSLDYLVLSVTAPSKNESIAFAQKITSDLMERYKKHSEHTRGQLQLLSDWVATEMDLHQRVAKRLNVLGAAGAGTQAAFDTGWAALAPRHPQLLRDAGLSGLTSLSLLRDHLQSNLEQLKKFNIELVGISTTRLDNGFAWKGLILGLSLGFIVILLLAYRREGA